jgi:hypothetical protein
MTTLRTLKKLLLGETWLLPLGIVAAVAVTGLLVRGGVASDRLGGFLLLIGVVVVLVLSVARSARPKTRARASAAGATPQTAARSALDRGAGGGPDD